MKFFTDGSVAFMKWPWWLTNMRKYKGKVPNYVKEALVDPCVSDLLTSNEYHWVGDINIVEFLNSLPENHFFSFDYPSDMNPKYEDLFLMKSWDNACRYNWHPQYITTVQGKFGQAWNYIEQFHKYNALEPDFLGLGNLCKHRSCNDFIKHTIGYIFKYSYAKRIHIYGLCKDAIPYCYKLAKKFKIDFSIDQEIWQYLRPSKLRAQDFKLYLIDLIDKGVRFEL